VSGSTVVASTTRWAAVGSPVIIDENDGSVHDDDAVTFRNRHPSATIRSMFGVDTSVDP
jgi:hypothetical protein